MSDAHAQDSLRIYFDCRYVRFERHDGISRFSAGLVSALAKLHPVTMLISDKRQLDMLPDLPWVLAPSPTSAAEPWLSRRINALNPDVVYSPMQTFGPFGRKFTLVTTVHDLIYYENRTPPRDLPWPVRLIWRLYHLSWAPQRFLLNRADAQATVSDTTRQLMVTHHLTKRPITVVPNAVDSGLAADEATEAASPTTGEPTPDILYMGSFMPYKNVELLARGMHELPGYRLHLLSRADDATVARLTELAPAGSLVFHQGVSDEEYAELLVTATALASASLNEGFGLPLIEAMAGGTPIVVSDIPIFREIGANAAEYFDPRDPQSFAAAVREIAKPDVRSGRAVLGRARAADFSWDASASALFDALRAAHAARTRQL